jgi:hypothetical protein
MKRNLCVGLILAGAVLTPSILHASDGPAERGVMMGEDARDHSLAAPTLTIDPSTTATTDAQNSQSASKDVDAPVLTLAAGGVGSRIHGFMDFRLATAYITPRGLTVVDTGVQFQPLGGLVFDLYQGDGPINDVSVIGGAWSDFTSSHRLSDGNADIWNEVDFFASVDVKFLKNFDFTATISPWLFPTVGSTPENNPHTEYNADFKLGYNDSDLLGAFALHPYADLFWNFAGQSSPVVAQATLGQNDKTFYVELGIAPSYTFKAITDYPITLTMPSYVSVGDSSFWGQDPGNGDRSNLGVASTGLKASMPLSFIPSDFGNWNAYVGVTYIYTCNPALSYVDEHVLGNADSHNLVYGYAGVGFSF